ncbi:MAG TPA: tyrosine protein kinase [Acidimicrobiia bacterium]|nr:tyrosine protein kinase [Acidimicrobiia bacterium]
MAAGLTTELAVHPPETDLIGVGAGSGEGGFEPHTTHTHYFGLQVPEAGIGAYLYIRYQPFFPLAQGGVVIFEGLDHRVPLDAAHLDYRMTMPYPTVDGSRITTDNGLCVDFLEPGRRVRITYESADAGFDVTQVAVTPLVAREAVIPGEDRHAAHRPGGSEQFMHCTGELRLHGRVFPVDCHMPRDRSWRQSRTEKRGGRHDAPIAWTPVYFPDAELAFNQVGFESPATGSGTAHHFAWICDHDELRSVVSVHRSVEALHPYLPAPLRQTILAEDVTGATYRFTGEAVALAPIPSWPNAGTFDSVVRWTDEAGRVGYGPCQGIWYDAYQRLMKERGHGR